MSGLKKNNKTQGLNSLGKVMSGKQPLAFPPYGTFCFICEKKRGQKLNSAAIETNSWAVKTHLKHVGMGSLE